MKRLKAKHIQQVPGSGRLGVPLTSPAHGVQAGERYFWHPSFQNFATFKL